MRYFRIDKCWRSIGIRYFSFYISLYKSPSTHLWIGLIYKNKEIELNFPHLYFETGKVYDLKKLFY